MLQMSPFCLQLGSTHTMFISSFLWFSWQQEGYLISSFLADPRLLLIINKIMVSEVIRLIIEDIWEDTNWNNNQNSHRGVFDMDDIKENIAATPMLSKIGKHIAQRITGGGRRRQKRFECKSESGDSPYQRVDTSPLKITYSNTVERIKKMRNHEFKPCVGHYKVKYSVIDKNNQKINFKKLIPHFARDKPSSNYTQTEYNDTPQKIEPRATGMKEFDRMTSREEIKGSVRRVGENPHEKRFELPEQDYWTDEKKLKNTVSFEKMMKRKCEIFKPREFCPDYDVNCEFGKKRLALSIIPFERQASRDQFYMINKNRSQLRDPIQFPSSLGKTVKFQQLLPRYKQSALPSYLDMGINTRASLNQRNWKTLKMNCYQSKTLNPSMHS